jgi:hypothetical protein
MSAAQMHCDDGPDEASMISAVLNSNAEYMQLMADTVGDPNRSPGGDDGQADAARQRLIAAVAAEVRKQSSQQHQLQHHQHQQIPSPTAAAPNGPARGVRTPAKRSSKRRMESSNENQDLTMQHLPTRSDNAHTPHHHPLAGLSQQPQQPQQQERRYPPPPPWQTSPQHFFHPPSQQHNDEFPQQQQPHQHHHSGNNAQYTPSHSQQQQQQRHHQHATTTPTATPHVLSGNAFAFQNNYNSNDRGADSATRQTRSRHQSQSGGEQQQMQSSADNLSLNIRGVTLESPIGLQLQNLPASRLETDSIAYSRPTEQLRAMLAARGSQSPIDNLDRSGSGGRGMPGSASLIRLGSASEVHSTNRDRARRSPTSSQMMSSGSSPGALMSSRYRTVSREGAHCAMQP